MITEIDCSHFGVLYRLLSISACQLQSLQVHLYRAKCGSDCRSLCRQLLACQPSILTSPAGERSDQIIIVLHELEYENKDLQATLYRMQLSHTGTRQITPHSVKQCLMFGLTLRLANQWNRLANLFVHTDDPKGFLDADDETQPLDAVLMIVENNDSKLEMYAKAGQIRTFPILPCNLKLSQLQMDKLVNDSEAVIQLNDDIKRPFVYLPTCNSTARLVSVSRNIVPSTQFQDYKDMRQYWRDAYDYRLPEDSTGIVYLNVVFGKSSVVYSYPSCCVHRQAPSAVVGVFPVPVLDKFRKALEEMLSAMKLTWTTEVSPCTELLMGGPTIIGSARKRKLQQDLEHAIQHPMNRWNRNTPAKATNTTSPYFEITKQPPAALADILQKATGTNFKAVTNRKPGFEPGPFHHQLFDTAVAAAKNHRGPTRFATGAANHGMVPSKITDYFPETKAPSTFTAAATTVGTEARVTKSHNNKLQFDGSDRMTGKSGGKIRKGTQKPAMEVDVRQLALYGQLNKARVRDIKQWLIDHQVPFDPKNKRWLLEALVNKYVQM